MASVRAELEEQLKWERKEKEKKGGGGRDSVN